MTSVKIVAIKQEDNLYMFNNEELLCNGTEKIIDSHYFFLTGKEAKPGNKIMICLSIEEPENEDDYDTLLTFQWADVNGSTYLDEVMCDTVWLGPWLQKYFGNLPNRLYVQVDKVKQ